MKLNLLKRFHSLISEPDRNLRMTLFVLLYAFMNVATKLTLSDRIALNPYYELFIAVGFIFAVLFCCGVFVNYKIQQSTKEILKTYNIQVIR